MTGEARGKPHALIAAANWLGWAPAHGVMQLKQFAGLRRPPRGPLSNAAAPVTAGAAANGAGLLDASALDSAAMPA